MQRRGRVMSRSEAEPAAEAVNDSRLGGAPCRVSMIGGRRTLSSYYDVKRWAHTVPSEGWTMTDLRLSGIHHVGLTVHDLERSIRFYRDVLGLRLLGQRIADADYV